MSVLAAGVVELERERSEDGKSIRLSWMQPSPVQARGNIAGYQIDFIEATTGKGVRRRRQGDCQSAGCVLAAGQVGGCCLVGGDQTSAMISGLDPGKAYNVSVSAVNGAGKGKSWTFTVDGGELTYMTFTVDGMFAWFSADWVVLKFFFPQQ